MNEHQKMTSSDSGKTAKITSQLYKKEWLDRAKEINRFHLQQCRDEKSWTVRQTALALNRSIGSVSQDLLIAQWCKTHEKQLLRCSSMKDALGFIRLKQNEQKFSGLD